MKLLLNIHCKRIQQLIQLVNGSYLLVVIIGIDSLLFLFFVIFENSHKNFLISSKWNKEKYTKYFYILKNDYVFREKQKCRRDYNMFCKNCTKIAIKKHEIKTSCGTYIEVLLMYAQLSYSKHTLIRIIIECLHDIFGLTWMRRKNFLTITSLIVNNWNAFCELLHY